MKKKKPTTTTSPSPTYTPPTRRPDFEINGRLNSLSGAACSVSFDNQADCQNYSLYYEEPNGLASNGQIVDGVYHRQVSSSYPASPIYVYFGWSPMYLNVYYKCRICCWFNDGSYAWSKPFDILTKL